MCTWGLSQLREQEVVQLAKRCADEPLSHEEVEIDQVGWQLLCPCDRSGCTSSWAWNEGGCNLLARPTSFSLTARNHPTLSLHLPAPQFTFIYSAHEHPSMSNDSITINRRQAADHQVKLAICHALAQVRAYLYVLSMCCQSLAQSGGRQTTGARLCAPLCSVSV